MPLTLLGGRRPLLVRLWSRERGLIVPLGNPRGLLDADDLEGITVLSQRGADSELELALAVAYGAAEAAIGLRAAAQLAELYFISWVTEPFAIVTTEERLGGLEPLLNALERPEVRGRIEGLGGYDLEGAGDVAALS